MRTRGQQKFGLSLNLCLECYALALSPPRWPAGNWLGHRLEIHRRLLPALAEYRYRAVHGGQLLPVGAVAKVHPCRHGLRRLDWHRGSGHGLAWHDPVRRIA